MGPVSFQPPELWEVRADFKFLGAQRGLSSFPKGRTIHCLVGRVVDGYIDEEAKEVAEVFEEGVIPE